MRKFIHIGMPKTLSSSLQEGFFPIHSDIHFLGVGVGSLIDYVSDSINRIFETLIPYASDSYYQLHKREAIESLNFEFYRAKENGRSWVGVSSEWLGFNFTPEMADPELKAARLAEVVGSDSHVILIVRNNFTFLKSLWAELVKVGLPLSFSDYCEYLWKFQDRSALYEMLYDMQYERISRYFRKENIHIIPLELYRNSDGSLEKLHEKISLIDCLCKILDIDYPHGLELPSVNPSLNDFEAYQKLELNKKYRHDFGNLIFEPSNLHRNRKQIEYVCNELGQDLFSDVKVKRLLLEQAKERAVFSESKITFTIPDDLRCNLRELFLESNIRFEKLSGVLLPEEYFNNF